MSSTTCIVCLRGAVNQVEVHHENLFLDCPGNTLEVIDKLNNSDSGTNNTIRCCSSCQLFFVRLSKLNTKLNTLVYKVKQSYDACTAKVRAVHNVGQPTLRTDEESWKSDHKGDQSDRQSEDGSIFGEIEANSLGSIPAGETAVDAIQCPEESQSVSPKDDGDPNPRPSKHNQRWVKVAPNRFQYGKYCVEKVDGLYKCGECGALKKPAKPYKFYLIRKHILDEHENSSRTCVCEYCGVIYNKETSLKVHKITKHGDPNGRFPCNECGKVFRNRIAVTSHKQSAHRGKHPPTNLLCETCGKHFNRIDYYEDHVAFVHNGLKKHECEVCGKRFGMRIGLKNHRNFHPEYRKHIYNNSGAQSAEENPSESNSVHGSVEVEDTSKNVPENHETTKVVGLVSTCAGPSTKTYEDNWLPKDLTLKSSQLVKRLSERDFIYKEEYPFQGAEFGFKCGLCPVVVKFFTDKTRHPWANMTNHLKRWHIGDPSARTTRVARQSCIEVAPNRFMYGKYSFERVDGMFQCGECGILKNPAEPNGEGHRTMVKHIAEKHENPYVCKDCGVVYSSRSGLNAHKTTKHGDPNGQFPCSDCGKIFSCRRNAMKHRSKVHLKRYRAKFICEICGKSFTKKEGMEDHVAFVQNGQRLNQCEECGKNFASRSVLNVHKNSHTGKKKFTCDICGMEFTQHYSVTRHKKTAHQD